jgi:hypothetical protein
VKERDLDNMEKQDLYTAAVDMSSQLESCIEYLEELRSSNKTLRDWGNDLVADLEEMETEIKALESRE